MLHGLAEDVLKHKDLEAIRGRVQLIFTSPPFPLNTKKKYGNLQGEEYLQWLTSFGSLFRELLTPDGSIVIELGNSWEPGLPTMSTLGLKALLRFQEENNLHLCQEFICHNPARLPSPAQWVTIERIRLKDSFTRLWWLSPSPRPKANNKNVLKEYSAAMQRLLKTKQFNAGIPANSIEAEINKFAPEQVSRFFLFDGELLQEYEELLIEGSEQGKKIKEAIEQALGVPALINGRDDLQILRKQAQKEQAKEAATVKGLESVVEQFSKWSGKRDVFDNDLIILKEKHAELKEERQVLEDEISASQALLEQKGELDAKLARRSEIAKELKDKNALKLDLAGEAWRDMLRPKIMEKKATLQKLQEEATRHISQRAKLQFHIQHLQDHMAVAT
jgi:hypothetical protein